MLRLHASTLALAAALAVAPALALAVGCTTKTEVVEKPAADTGAPADDAGAEAAEPAPFALTSTAFEEGGKIPSEHTCDGANVSPPLSWTAGPEGTKSYAIVFTDTDNGLVHAVIYDIPASVTSLPKNVENAFEPATPQGAKQTKSYKPTVFGYAGPCPSGTHTYEFALYALDVDTLPNVTQTTAGAAAETEIKKHDLAVVKLKGTYTR